MPLDSHYDAIVVGSGPNGLAAAITIAQAGYKSLVLEAQDTVGGGCRSTELTLPGFIHDPCATIHALGLTSPFLRELPLDQYELEWVYSPASLAHPLDDGSAILLERSVEETSNDLSTDAKVYRRLFEPFVENWESLAGEILGPFHLPFNKPMLMARFGWYAIRSAYGLANNLFRGERARALFAGLGGHSIQSLEKPITAAFGLVMGISGHAVGWPMARGGSQKITDALVAHLKSLGGEVLTNSPINNLNQLPSTRAVFLDVTPRQFLTVAGDRLPSSYRRQLERYRYGPGVFKIDYALDGPVPWKASECFKAATVHLGGTLKEIASAEKAVWNGNHPERPFILLVQQTVFDTTRAPQGKHTVWAYTHVPNGSTVDISEQFEAQIERFAPGFRERVLARCIRNPIAMEQYNQNYIGGDINGGVQDIAQLFTRPIRSLVPYVTPINGVYLCSSSTPPGGGVHGMCGYYAAKTALKKIERSRRDSNPRSRP